MRVLSGHEATVANFQIGDVGSIHDKGWDLLLGSLPISVAREWILSLCPAAPIGERMPAYEVFLLEDPLDRGWSNKLAVVVRKSPNSVVAIAYDDTCLDLYRFMDPE